MFTTPVAPVVSVAIVVSDFHRRDHGSGNFGTGRVDPDPMAYDASGRTITVDGRAISTTFEPGDSLSGHVNMGKHRPLPFPRSK